MFKCYNCGDLVRVPIFYGEHFLCERCHRLTNLPTLVLTKRWFCDMLYNPNTGYYFRMGETAFSGCGFKLYKKIVFDSKSANEKFSESRIYRYFGKIGCRLLDTKDLMTFKIHCKSFTCNN